jgi:hypothetical protein
MTVDPSDQLARFCQKTKTILQTEKSDDQKKSETGANTLLSSDVSREIHGEKNVFAPFWNS